MDTYLVEKKKRVGTIEKGSGAGFQKPGKTGALKILSMMQLLISEKGG